ncbi:hypothetical protein AQJ46_10195 [Streptomyces canus]|uniref:Uncharacterized protein n=1 Tax=Streptomyces canus TaxID=58343 RepID=A0A101SFE7_9ACTN|nr:MULTISPECIES: DUF5949 family protein [Streptomyces]KUN72772.1 hypothetical protein AQJ46_10195 [Streptomyces canus]MDI5905963.1 DUF5949 family protein [Streptomyces sp. 12257]
MTTTSSETHPLRSADPGTLVIMAWSGEAPDGHDMPYLLACSLGDAPDGPEAATAAVEKLLNDNGLPVGGDLVDGNVRPSLPVTLLVVAGHAVVTMPRLNAKCPVRPQWLAAVAKRGYAYFVFTTRPWPEASGQSVTPDELAAFAGSDETLKAAAHIVLPARSLRS